MVCVGYLMVCIKDIVVKAPCTMKVMNQIKLKIKSAKVMRLYKISNTNVMFIMYGELSRPSTCALRLAMDDIYINSFILDERALERHLTYKINVKPLD